MKDDNLTTEQRVEKLVDSFQAEMEKGVSKNAETLEAIKKEIDAELAAFRDEWKKLTAGASVPGSGDSKHEGKEFQWSKAMYGVATGQWQDAGHEKEIMDAAREKTMATSPDSAGGFVVPIEVLQEQIIPRLEAASVVIASGATVMNGLTAIPTLIPRVSGGTTAYWVAENSAITSADMTFEQLRLEPKIVAALTSMSDLVNNVSNPSLEKFVRNDFATRIALAIDLGALNGSGVDGEPTGIFQTSGVSTNTWTDGALTFDMCVDFVQGVEAGNALDGNLGWIMSQDSKTDLWKIKDVEKGTDDWSDQPLQRRVLASGPLDTLMGYGYRVSTQLGANKCVFGNWADLIVAMWGGVNIATTNAVGFASLQNHIRISGYVDTGVRHTASFEIDGN